MSGSSTSIDEGELRKQFDQIDTSGDGSLDSDELLEVSPNPNPTPNPNPNPSPNPNPTPTPTPTP